MAAAAERKRGRGRLRGSYAEQARHFARLVEEFAPPDLPRAEKIRLAMIRVPKGMPLQEAVATTAIAVLEEEQRAAQDRIRRMETQHRERQRAELDKIARVSLALRRRPLACSAGRHRRAPAASSSSRRGSRRSSRAGPRSASNPDEAEGDGESPPSPALVAGSIAVPFGLPDRAAGDRAWRAIFGIEDAPAERCGRCGGGAEVHRAEQLGGEVVCLRCFIRATRASLLHRLVAKVGGSR